MVSTAEICLSRPPKDRRPILHGLLWLLRTGAPWRDLPLEYGPWGTVATRYEKRAVNYSAMLTITAIML